MLPQYAAFICVIISFAFPVGIGAGSKRAMANSWLTVSDWARTELYYGLSMEVNDTNVVITDDEFEQYLAEVVTPLFPDGLTVFDTTGQWLNSDGEVFKKNKKNYVYIDHLLVGI